MRILPLAAVTLCLTAQTITKSRIADGLASIDTARLKSDIAYLASDKLQGRLSLQPGSQLAIDWIVAQYKAAGVEPAGPGHSYLQRVPLIEYRADPDNSGLTIRRNGKSETYRYPDAYEAYPANTTVRGAVVFAGFGITAPELHYDDYAGIDAKGKIVLIFDHEPQETDVHSVFNGKGNTRYAGTYVKTLNAQKHGAVAVLVVAEPNRNHPSNQERLARIKGRNERAKIPLQALAERPIHIPAYTISDAIAADLLGGHQKELQQAIDSTLKPQSKVLLGLTAELKIAATGRRRADTYNVLGVVKGSDPTLSAETIVFSAHYDHDGITPNGGIFHGADDNASGTTGVVELARAFQKNGVKPRRSLLFAVFAAEERGLLGSYSYVAHPTRPLNTTRAVINFDMIGRNETPSDQTNGLIDINRDTSNELNLVGTNYSPSYKQIVERANNMVGLDLNYKWDEEPALNVYFRSDHYPFALHDIPSLWWFTGFHPDYHQITDTADRINYEKMAKILKLAFITGFDLAETPDPPQFKP